MRTVRTLAESIKERRSSLGLSLSQLARDTGYDVASLSNVEAGRRGLSLSGALSLARRFGCSVEDLAELDDDTADAPTAAARAQPTLAAVAS